MARLCNSISKRQPNCQHGAPDRPSQRGVDCVTELALAAEVPTAGKGRQLAPLAQAPHRHETLPYSAHLSFVSSSSSR
jgi:hypothetical protein